MFNRALRGMLLAMISAWGIMFSGEAQAEFQFGYVAEATNQQVTIDCNRGGAELRCFKGQRSLDSDTSPFLQEVVEINGIRYFHSILGDPNSDFVQEVYINASGCCYQARSSFDPFPKSSSGTNGTGNPTRIVMRNMVKDTEMTQWFIKDTLQLKPLITQNVQNAEVSMNFSIDMTGIDFGTIDTAGLLSNRLELLDGYRDTGDYDNAVIPAFFSDKSNVRQIVNAGRYTYTPGAGEGGSEGEYTYWDGGYDEYMAHELLFRRADQNACQPLRYGDVC